MDFFTFCITGEVHFKRFAEQSLAGYHCVKIDEARALPAAVLLDNFTSELYLTGRILLQSDDQLVLLDLQKGGWFAEDVAGCAGGWKFPGDLQGAVGVQLSGAAKLRSFQPVVSLVARITNLALLDDEDKTVVRLTLLNLAARENNVTIGFAESLRGYEDDAESLQVMLLARGAQPCTMRQVYKGLDLPLPTYFGKPEVALEPAAPAKESAGRIIVTNIKTARLNEPGIVSDHDTEFLHDYRVALRKVRSVLSLFQGVYSAKDTERLKLAVADVMKSTNKLRDLDVFLLNREAYLAAVPQSAREGLEFAFRKVAEERALALQEVVKTLQSKSYAQKIVRIGARFASPAKMGNGPHAGERSLDMACRLIMRRFLKVCKTAQAINAATPDEEIHRLRIHCKKLRYLMEFFAPLFAEEAIKPLIKALKRLQDRLGDFNDYSVQRRFIRELLPQGGAADGGDIRMSESIGVLGGILHMKQLAERAKILEAFALFNSRENHHAFTNLFCLEDS